MSISLRNVHLLLRYGHAACRYNMQAPVHVTMSNLRNHIWPFQIKLSRPLIVPHTNPISEAHLVNLDVHQGGATHTV